MLFSQALLVVAVSLITKAVALGFGRPHAALDPDALYGIATYGAIYSAASTVIVASARISFAVALLRLTLAGWGRVLVRVVIVGLVCVTAVPPVVARFTICDPFQKVYGQFPGGRCGNTYIPLYLGWASGAWSAASDFALTLLAWKIIWSMTMRPKEKVGVAIALSFGLLSGMITIFRYTYVALIYTRDFFEYGYFGFIWMAAEGATSIIAASIPALRAFVVERSRNSLGWRRWLPALGGASDGPKSWAPVVTPRSSPGPRFSSGRNRNNNIHRRMSDPNDVLRGDEWDLEMSRCAGPIPSAERFSLVAAAAQNISILAGAAVLRCAIATALLGVLYLAHLSLYYHRELEAKYSLTNFVDAVVWEASRLKGQPTEDGMWGTPDLPDKRDEWERIGGSFDGALHVYNHTAIKTFATSRSPLRNCIDHLSAPTRIPTEIPATLLLGGHEDHVAQTAEFLPPEDIFGRRAPRQDLRHLPAPGVERRDGLRRGILGGVEPWSELYWPVVRDPMPGAHAARVFREKSVGLPPLRGVEAAEEEGRRAKRGGWVGGSGLVVSGSAHAKTAEARVVRYRNQSQTARGDMDFWVPSGEC
ncbi:hypothetical protein DL768_003181 [Monosporascus sp. mg162]|nr:hypothetical protein DL768_003181 [Monosporascus sp. mg162]